MREHDLFGHYNPDHFAIENLEISKFPMGDILLNGVQVYYALFEISLASSLAQLPPSVHPSVPGMAGIMFWRIADSPWGPFSFAQIGIACRTGIKPRHLVVDCFASSPAAVNYLRHRHGFAVSLADVNLQENYDRVIGTVSLRGEKILEVETRALTPIIGGNAFIKISPALNAVAGTDGPELLQFDASYEFERVVRGTPRVTVFESPKISRPNLVLQTPVSGAYAVADITIHDPRYLLPSHKPVERVGVRKLTPVAAKAARA